MKTVSVTCHQLSSSNLIDTSFNSSPGDEMLSRITKRQGLENILKKIRETEQNR